MGKGQDVQATGSDYDEVKDRHVTGHDNKVAPEVENAVVITTEIESSRDSAAISLEKLKQRREQEPLLYCKIITKYPLRSFLLTLAAHISMLLVSIVLIGSGYDLLPVDFENLPLELNNLPWRPRDLAWTYRESFTDYYDRDPSAGYRSNSYRRTNIDLYYDGGNANVFTKGGLEKIQEIENRLTSVPGYISSYCQLTVNLTACEKPTSILRYFDGTYSDISPTFNDPTFSNIVGVLYEAYTNNDTKSGFQFFLGRSHEISSTTAFSSITRSVIPMGFPLPQHSGDIDGYLAELRTFSAEQMEPILEDVMKNNGVFTFSYRSDMLWTEYVFNRAMQDVVFAVGSICFIFVLILIHTKSSWIAGFGILSILMSFVTTNLIYRLVLDFRYIGFFHVLTLFIVLGIGADDIFVFYDVWKNTGYEDYPSLSHRLSDAYRKSVFSMLFTSITTSVAFFASAISPLLATRSFGVFSGMVVLVNYLSVVIYFPTVVVMYHTRYEHFRWPCVTTIKRTFGKWFDCCKPNSELRSEQEERKQVKRFSRDKRLSFSNEVYSTEGRKSVLSALADDLELRDNTKVIFVKKGDVFKTEITIDKTGDTIIETRIPDEHTLKKRERLHFQKLSASRLLEDFTKTDGCVNPVFANDDPHCGDNTLNTLDNKTPKGILKSNIADEKKTTGRYGVFKTRKTKSLMVRFFREKYFWFVTNNIFRVLILIACAGVLTFFTIQATRLEPATTGLRVLRDDHVYSVARDHALYSFVQSDSDRTITVYIVWGMLENDMSDCHFSTPKCTGELVWDPTFNPSTPEAQIAVKNLCDKMLNFTADEADRFKFRTDFTTGRYQIDCYMNNLEDFLDAETVSTGTDWGIPFNFTKSIAFMDNRTTFYNSSGFTTAYEDYLQIPISDWLSNKQTYNYTNDFFVFDKLIGEEIGTFSRSINTLPDKKYGNTIKYVGIQVNTTLNIQSLGFSAGIPIMTDWENFINEEMQKMPDGMKNGFQQTHLIWHWLIVQETLVENALYGVIIGVSFAYPMFIIATRNIITGTLATLTICCSTVCVIGVIPLGGWKLGVLEGLNMCMVVGLTVDYVIHLAEGYTLSLRTDRLSRVQDMLDEMAVSIFFGACTTLGASLFMFLAELSFFFQFGLFMFSTIVFSLFFSMLLFVTLMGIIGPQDDTGNVVVMIQNLYRRCKGGSSNKEQRQVSFE